MELGAEVAQMVMESRVGSAPARGGSVPAAVIADAAHVVATGVPLCIHALIAHESCQRAAAQCANAALIEVWTITLKRKCPNDEKVLDALFLKNAVRSHLHFSQLNSWIANNGGKLTEGTVCAYRVSVNECGGEESESAELHESHSFPVARCSSSAFLVVTVRWRKSDAPPELAPCVSMNGYRYSGEDWLLPSGSISSSVSSHSFSSPGSCSETPQFFVSPDDDRFINFQRGLFGGDGSGEDEGLKPSPLCSSARSPSPDGSYLSMHVDDGHSSADSPNSSSNCAESPQRRRKNSRGKHSRRQLQRSPGEPPSKRNSFEQPDGESAQPPDSPTTQLFDALDGFSDSTAGDRDGGLMNGERVVVGATEVESLADFLAVSSSISPLPAATPEPASASRRESVPRRSLVASAFRFMSSASVAFSKKTGLPLNSSPAPLTRNERSVESRFSAKQSNSTGDDDSGTSDNERLCTARSAPTSTGLLCNFEESALNGRLEPLAALDGFRLQIAASGSFCAPHVTLPVTTFFFNLSDDHAPSPYLGHCSLEHLGRKGYHIPKKGILQATLFNPQGTVVRIFVVRFDVSEMPLSSQTFLRQRTFFMPADCSLENAQRSWLRYLIHLRLATDHRGRLYVHTDIRMLFSQKSDLEALNVEVEKDSQQFQLRSFTEMPQKPRFSPRK